MFLINTMNGNNLLKWLKLYKWFDFLPNDILHLIQLHSYSLMIQQTYKLNRPLTKLTNGNRIYYLSNKKRIYGTIIYNNGLYSKVQKLPRLIPNLKNCNLEFWINYQHLLPRFCFPYYLPKYEIIENSLIIKLKDWNCNNINNIEGINRIKINFNEFLNYKSKMFPFYI